MTIYTVIHIIIFLLVIRAMHADEKVDTAGFAGVLLLMASMIPYWLRVFNLI